MSADARGPLSVDGHDGGDGGISDGASAAAASSRV